LRHDSLILTIQKLSFERFWPILVGSRSGTADATLIFKINNMKLERLKSLECGS